MANSLLITKLSDGSFSFVLNSDTVNTIVNLRNDMTTVGDEAHFKTSNGANLIKEQQILFNQVTIVDGATLPVATSSIDLRLKLRSVGFWDWMLSGGSGVNRFDALLDAFSYFGNDGKVPMVDESQLKLIPFSLPDVSYLNYFPNPLQALKSIRVKGDLTGYEFYDAVNMVTQFIRSGFVDTSPSEDVLNQALSLKANVADIINPFPKIQITATAGQTVFPLGTTILANSVFWEGALLDDNDWIQSGTNITTTFPFEAGQRFKAT